MVENDADRLVTYYKHTVSVFSGASDLIKYCINRRKMKNLILMQMRLVVLLLLDIVWKLFRQWKSGQRKRQINC